MSRIRKAQDYFDGLVHSNSIVNALGLPQSYT